MRTISKVLCMIAAAAMIGCSGPAPQNKQDSGQAEPQDQKKKEPPVFSLFKQYDKSGYQLYHNSNKLATIAIDDNREVLAMKTYKGCAYLLISQLASDTAIIQPSEIYKNGRPAMTFDSSFAAIDMVIYEGHFYVMGKKGSSDTIMVYRDGIEELAMQADHRKACKLGTFRQDIYVAFQKGDSVEITRNGNVISSMAGQCRGFDVSHMGYYTLTDSEVYRDRDCIMKHEYYRHSDKELFADPMYISLDNANCYVGSQAQLDAQHYYGAVFRNNEAFLTIRPDNKNLGQSDILTRCVGVSSCGDGCCYSASYLTDINGRQLTPTTFDFYYNSNKVFSIDFVDTEAKLLFLKADQ